MRIDLHIHTHFSDGKYAPAKIVEYALKNGLDVIAVTDHDTIAGLPEIRTTLSASGKLKLVSGVELSTALHGEEIHILGYGVDETHAGFLEYLKVNQAKRKTRIRRILEQLERVGIYVTLEDVKNGFRTMSLGRMHVASALIKRGYVHTIRDAFDRYLGDQAKLLDHQAADFLSPEEAIRIILEAGGIPVLAHPTISLFDRHIDWLISYGLRGVEVFKDSRPSIEEFYLETVVKDKGLLLTGGSDWHGYHATRPLGSFYVNAEQVHSFLAAVQLD